MAQHLLKLKDQHKVDVISQDSNCAKLFATVEGMQVCEIRGWLKRYIQNCHQFLQPEEWNLTASQSVPLSI